jgi:hypothetical protein
MVHHSSKEWAEMFSALPDSKKTGAEEQKERVE